MKKVNGKPYLRTQIAFRGVVFRQPNDVFVENSYPYAGKSGIRDKKKGVLFAQMSLFSGK